MMLFALLLVPVLIGLGGLLFSKGRVTWKEFLVHEGVIVVIIGVGYAIAYWGQTTDTEIWNGTITRKWQDTGGCCHSYPCNPHPCSCDSNGNCSTCWDTCYEHIADDTYNATTSNGETAYFSGCHRPGSSSPERWRQIVVGEPAAIEHRFTNYIKGSPDTILRRQGVAEKFQEKIPPYPRVYDHYRARRFIAVGANIPSLDALDDHLDRLNANYGALKQINITVIVTDAGDQMYLEALTEAWLGGKKNDLVVVIGAPEFPKIAWAGVMSWTKVEEVKIGIRNGIVELGTFDGDRILNIIAQEVQGKFVRRPMSDFAYLKATIEPPEWAKWTLFFFGLIVAIGLQIYFWKEDPFGARYPYGRQEFRRLGGLPRRPWLKFKRTMF